MRSIHAIIFDMDGLVFDSERITMESFIRAARHFGFQMNELMHLNLTGRVEEDCAAQMQRMYGQDKDVRAWRAYFREQKASIRKAQGGCVGKRPGLLALLSYLHERDIPFALASSSTRQTIDSYLESEYLLHALVLEDGLAGITAANVGGFVSGFVYDDLSFAGSVDTGFPILIDLMSVDDVRTTADVSFDTLNDVIGYLEKARSVRQ